MAGPLDVVDYFLSSSGLLSLACCFLASPGTSIAWPCLPSGSIARPLQGPVRICALHLVDCLPAILTGIWLVWPAFFVSPGASNVIFSW